MRRFLLLLFIIGMSIFFANAVYAVEVASTDLNVNANAVAACSVTTSPVNFVDYIGQELTSTGNVQVTCAEDIAYRVCLGAGLHYTGTGNRRMLGDDLTSYIEYQLKSNVNIQWGDTFCGDTYPASPLSTRGTGGAQNFVVNGTALAGPAVPPGDYSDVVRVTVDIF